MGYREYARHRGCAMSTVQKAIKDGRIDVEIIKGQKKIDWKDADEKWSQNTDTYRPSSTDSGTTKKVKGPTYQQSRAIREAYQAKLAKIEYEQKIGKLVDADQVKRHAFEMGRRIRDAILNIPARISNELLSADNAFDIEQILNREFDEVLKNLSDG